MTVYIHQLEIYLLLLVAVQSLSLIHICMTGARQWSPMGSSANLEGRMLAQVLSGREKSYGGVLGTGVVKLPGLNCGRTGLTEQAARDAG